VIQPRVTASRLKSDPIAGRATFSDETVYGTRNDAREEMSRRIDFPA